MSATISIQSVSRSFGGIQAVVDCSFEVKAGSVTGLVGPNGAGKSTLFNVVSGFLPPSSGRITMDGDDITGVKPHELFAKGLVRTFQIAHEFSRMTVLDNLMVVPAEQTGEDIAAAWFRWGRIRLEEEKVRDHALEVLDYLRLTSLKHELAGNLSGGQKKLLELGRTMMAKPRVVLLDELGAGVNCTLLATLAGDIERLNQEHGYTFCIIEHDMDLISRLCDPVVVMAEGTVLTQGPMAEIKRNEEVIDAYLGGGMAPCAPEGIT